MKYLILTLIMLFYLGFGQNMDKQENALSSIRGIRVKVLRISKDIKDIGISEKIVKKLIEDTLYQSGLNILNDESWKRDQSKASLSIQIVTNRSNNLEYYNVNLYLHIKQMSILKRTRNNKDISSTWYRSPMLHIRKVTFKDDISKNVKTVVGEFIKEYQLSNNMEEK